jgi:hypothetical protein
MLTGQRVEVPGEVLEGDVKQRKFQFWLDGQSHVQVMFSDPKEDTPPHRASQEAPRAAGVRQSYARLLKMN